MKRIFFLLVALILCVSVLAVPAFAAEPDEYIFEVFEPVSLYSDYEFFPIGSSYTSAACEHRLPEGSYDVYVFDDNEQRLFCGSVTVDYSYLHEVEDVTFPYSLSLVDLDGSTYELYIFDVYDVFGVTMLGLVTEGTSIKIMTTVKFVPSEDAFDVPFALISDLMQRLFQLITDNPLLSALCAASLILVCIPLFVDLKKSAR